MHVLVVNCGSSSLKASVVDPATGGHVADHTVERIGQPGQAPDAAAALELALGALITGDRRIDAVGHRVVHGADQFVHPTPLSLEVIRGLEALVPLAPLHLPANLAGIRAATARLPGVPHVAVFDTAFHATLPPRAQRYALPSHLCDRHGVRRYGFHGPSHAWVAEQAAAWMEAPLADLRLITCHLGNGCSVTAIEGGRSVETSMGMTPVEGLVMGTRSGDVDIGAVLHLARAEGMDLDAIDGMVNDRSGLLGLSGVGNDFRDIEARAAEGDAGCRAAIGVFTHRLRKYIGAYAAVLGGVDAIVFTGGIGQNSALVRHRAAQRLDFLGARLDEDRNRDAKVGLGDGEPRVCVVSTPHSRCPLLVVATDEAAAIARQVADEVRGLHVPAADLRIPIAVSARHVHLTPAAVHTLFGAGHTLTRWRDISQPGQYACEERVTLVGPKGAIPNVRVLGPTRSRCQVEVSRTDEFTLGIDAPIRGSGDVANSPGIVLEGPAGRLVLDEGVIQAQRHIHMTPADAKRLGVVDRDVVAVGVDTDGRDLVFGDVLVRVSDQFVLEMHIDTDEANAAELKGGAEGVLDPTGGRARVVRLGR